MEDLEGRLEVVILEKEVALKEERNRMEKNLKVKDKKLELEKEAWQNFIETTRNKNSVLEEELEEIKKDVLGAEDDKKVLEGELRRLEEEVKLLRQEKDQSNKDFRKLQKVIERNDEERGGLNDKMEKVKQDKRWVCWGVCLLYLCAQTYLPTYLCTHIHEYIQINIDIVCVTSIRRRASGVCPHHERVSSLQGCVLTIGVCPPYRGVSSLQECVLTTGVCPHYMDVSSLQFHYSVAPQCVVNTVYTCIHLCTHIQPYI